MASLADGAWDNIHVCISLKTEHIKVVKSAQLIADSSGTNRHSASRRLENWQRGLPTNLDNAILKLFRGAI